VSALIFLLTHGHVCVCVYLCLSSRYSTVHA